MDEKELFDNLDGMDIPDSAKDKVKKMLKKKQEKVENMEDRKELAKLIAKELKELIPDGKKWLEAIKDLEVKAPKVEVNIPEIKIPSIKSPEVKIPAIIIPKQEAPIVNIPKIEIPKIELPKIVVPKQEIIIPNEMEIKGMEKEFNRLEKSIEAIIKNKLSVVLHGGIDNTGTVERDNPIPVIPVDENGKILRGGGGIDRVSTGAGLSTKANQDVIISHIESVIDPNDLTLRTEHYYALIAQDKVVGHSVFSKFGKIVNPSITNLEIISNIPVVHPGGQQLTMVSTSASDNLTGTGLQKVELIYYTATDWTKKSEILELNGLTPVLTTGTDIGRIESFDGYQVGSNNVAEGDITLKDSGATETYAVIEETENKTLRCLHYAEPGCKAFITDILISSHTSQGIEFRLVATHDHSKNTIPGGRVPTGLYASKALQGTTAIHFNVPLKVDASNSDFGLGIFLVARGEIANQECFGGYVGYNENS